MMFMDKLRNDLLGCVLSNCPVRTLEKILGHSVGFTVTHDLRDTRAILLPILNLKEPYLLRAGQTNVEMKLIMQAEIKTSAKLLD